MPSADLHISGMRLSVRSYGQPSSASRRPEEQFVLVGTEHRSADKWRLQRLTGLDSSCGFLVPGPGYSTRYESDRRCPYRSPRYRSREMNRAQSCPSENGLRRVFQTESDARSIVTEE